MRFLIPLAGPETMFPREDYHFPKPQIEIDGKAMIARVIENLAGDDAATQFVFIVSADDCRRFSLDDTLKLSSPGDCNVVQLERYASGAACSALMAIDLIDDDQPLVLSNGDHLFDVDLAQIFREFEARDLDAGVVTFESVHPRWSYVRLDDQGLVTEAAEKRVISRNAIAGLYYFRRGSDFVACAKASIANGRSVDGKFFIAPTLNEAILAGLKVGAHKISEDAYHSFFSPQRLEIYERKLQGERQMNTTPSKRLQIVVPMAGLGSRFANAGYDKPKPFIDVFGKPMIVQVMDNLRVPGSRFVLITRKDLLDDNSQTIAELQSRGDAVFRPIDLVTEGAACTVLLARAMLDPEAPLLIANCDQIVDFDCSDFIRDSDARGLDGSILCFRDAELNPKWSFARLEDGLVVEVQEKKPISDLATVGLYYFRRAKDFINAATDMIANNDRSNGEFYVCPVYNYSIAAGQKIGVYEIAQSAMHGIGTPEDLETYLRTAAR